MWAKMLPTLGRFIAKRGATIALYTAVAAAAAGVGAYLVHVIEDRGALQERLKASQRETEQARRSATEWQNHAGAIRELSRRFDQYDRELSDAKEDRRKLAARVDTKIEDLRRELPEVDNFLSVRAPDALVRVYCNDGTIAADSSACADLDP